MEGCPTSIRVTPHGYLQESIDEIFDELDFKDRPHGRLNFDKRSGVLTQLTLGEFPTYFDKPKRVTPKGRRGWLPPRVTLFTWVT